jgi:hypothetical protein
MRYGIVAAVFVILALPAYAQVPAEVEACRLSGLVALKERSPAIKDLTFDIDGLAISKAETKVEDTPVKMVVMGDAYLQREKTDKPNRFLGSDGSVGSNNEPGREELT